MLTLNPTAILPVIFNQALLALSLKSEDPPVIAFVKKVISTATNQNTILRIYLCKSDSSVEVIPPGTLFGICQIKTASSQVVIDFLLSKDYVPLKPVWYTEYCEQMIVKHQALLNRETMFLAMCTLTSQGSI